MIKFKNVTKVYNKTIKAVNNVSFEVRGGEIVGFTGPNGSGKTTTIKMLTGILPPDSGKIKINGFDIKKNMIQAKSSIGYIADSPDMFLRLKGIEFLNFIADVYKVSDDDRKKRVSELAERFELTDALSSPMMSYSHGMRQKLMVIAALVHNPPVWILDEPMTGLDPKSSYELKEMMREHAKKGNAVFFSTHVLEVAEKLCDKVIIIKKGNLLYDGTLENLESQHLNQTLENIFLEMTEN
ncbi:MAG: ABC transporter ATP-binding protein [Candidatus Pseudoruminococcus sp.]|uniref:ABC transporter ATP-binding protein n=1 Tax=Candidatus Pseudoruminococcus sp. TaxID=3101048 RepID=UPI002A7C57DA|nr:ABC transporter ATP-binding protein [Ruminococcus sp.]MDY2781953.1 ABC transporter ATP-binding protein [Candidatus Pseudoruminococcus sp.]